METGLSLLQGRNMHNIIQVAKMTRIRKYIKANNLLPALQELPEGPIEIDGQIFVKEKTKKGEICITKNKLIALKLYENSFQIINLNITEELVDATGKTNIRKPSIHFND